MKEVWKYTLGNPELRIKVLIVLILPALFAGIFLGSMWDPYGNAKNLKVAVINNDKPAKLYDETLKIGDKVEENLLDNEDLSFEKADAKAAAEGLKKGNYFMVVTIPKDFSANAATVLDKEPKKMGLKFEVNPGINFLGAKITSTAADNITAAVNKEVTEQYSSAILEATMNMVDGLNEAADGSDGLRGGVEKLLEGYDKLDRNTGKLEYGVDNLENGVGNLGNGVDNLDNGVSNMKNGVSNLSSGVSNLENGADNLQNGASSLQGGITNYTEGVSKSYEGAQNLETGASNMLSGVESLQSGLNNIPNSDTLNQLSGALSTLKGSINALSSVDTSNPDAVAAAIAKVKGQSAALDGASGALSGISSGVASAKSNVSDKLLPGAQQLQQGSSTLVSNMDKLVSMNETLNSGAEKLSSGADNMVSGASNLKNGTQRLESGTDNLESGTNKLKSGTQNLKNGTGKLINGTDKLVSGVNNMGEGMGKLDEGADTMQQKLHDGSDEANDKLGNVSERTKTQISEPVVGKTRELISVDKMGMSMAAFLATVGIWLGAMCFCMMFPIKGEEGQLKKPGLQAWATNAAVMYPLSAVWGAAIVPLMNIVFHMHPASWPLTILVGALTGMCLVTVIYFLNVSMGGPAIAVVLLLLSCQLAAGGGIFPQPMTGKFYQVLHIFMPFSYSIEAFRSTLANGNSILIPCVVLIAITAALSAASIFFLQKSYKRDQEVHAMMGGNLDFDF